MTLFVRLFPLWVLAASALALAHPPLFAWFIDARWAEAGSFVDLVVGGRGFVTPGLMVIMLGMGLTLEVSDFQRVARAPRPVLLGVLLQYTVMPALGWSMGYLYGLPTPFAVGLILVCSCPGGTASNVIAYLARADVALSVSMTTVSTLLAALMTPLLTTWLAGGRMEVDAFGLFESAAKVVLLPVCAGVLGRRYLPRFTRAILPFAPGAAVVMVVLIVAAVLGKQRGAVLDAGPALVMAVFSAHALGFLAGFVLGGLAGGGVASARTVSIEVGMQNSGLGVVLARANFAANPLVAIPAAISAIFHCVIGSALAAWWARRPGDAKEAVIPV